MSVLGDAWVVIRAITKNLNKDIKDGLDGAAADAEGAGNNVGDAFTKGVSDKINGDLSDTLADAIDDAADDAEDRADRRGGGIGRRLAVGFLSGLTGALGAAASLAGLFAMVTGLTGGIGGLIGALGALASGLVAVTAAATPALAAIGVVGVAAIGALVQGIGVAFGIFSQLKGELSELTPAARDVRTAFDEMKTSFGDLFAEVGEKSVFPQLASLLETIGGELFPILEEGIRSTGVAIGNVIGRFDALLQNPLFQSDLATILSDNAALLESLGGGFVNLSEALVSVLAAASPLINRFADFFEPFTRRIADLARVGQETGKLTQFFNKAGDVAAQLGDILKNLWGVLRDVFQAAAPLGKVFLDNFQRSTAALNTFLDSATGLESLNDYFRPGGQIHKNISATWELLKALGVALKDLSENEGIETLANGLTRSLPAVTAVVNSAIVAVGKFAQALGNAFESPAGRKGVEALQRGIEELGDAFVFLAPAIGPLLEIVGDLGRNLAELLAPAFRAISETLPKLVGPLDRIGDALGDALLAAVRALLPLLVQLAEIAADLTEAFAGPLGGAIQLIAAAMGGLLSVLDLLLPVLLPLAPAITAIATALAALKIATVVSVWMTGLRTALSGAAAAGTGVAANAVAGTTALGRFGAAARGAGGAGGLGMLARGAAGTVAALGGPWSLVIGAAIAGLTLFKGQQEESAQQTEAWSQALVEGGGAAAKALDDYDDSRNRLSGTGIGDWFQEVDEWLGLKGSIDDASQASSDYLNGLPALERAQALLTRSQNDLNYAIETGNTQFGTVKQLESEVANNRAILNMETERAAIAQSNWTLAMQAGNVEALASIQNELAVSNSKLQTQVSVDSLATAMSQLNELRANPEATAEQIAAAERNVQASLNNSVTSAVNAALAIGEVMLASGRYGDASDAFNVALGQQVRALDLLIAQSEGPTRAALEALKAQLLEIDGFDPEVAIRLQDEAIRNGMADTQATFREIEALEAKPTIGVNDQTKPPVNDILGRLLNVNKQRPTPSASLITSSLQASARAAESDMLSLGSRRPTPIASLNPAPFNGLYNTVMGSIRSIEGQRPTPVASLTDRASGPAKYIRDSILGIPLERISTVTTINRTINESVKGSSIRSTRAGGGPINSDQWSTVGEEGREMVFLSQGSYVATYQKAQRILAAASMQAANIAANGAGTTTLAPVPVAVGGGGVTIPITVNPSAQMDELDLARKTGREFAFQFRKIT